MGVLSVLLCAVCHTWNVFLFLLQQAKSRNEKRGMKKKKSENGCVATEQLPVRTGVYRHKA
jgi:hypothetical protein